MNKDFSFTLNSILILTDKKLFDLKSKDPYILDKKIDLRLKKLINEANKLNLEYYINVCENNIRAFFKNNDTISYIEIDETLNIIRN